MLCHSHIAIRTYNIFFFNLSTFLGFPTTSTIGSSTIGCGDSLTLAGSSTGCLVSLICFGLALDLALGFGFGLTFSSIIVSITAFLWEAHY